MHRRERIIWILTASAFAIGLFSLAFPDMVFHPGNVVPELDGDGGKNTFTYLYHIFYDKGVWFTGMNYPYGENIVYTDGQPLLSTLLQGCTGLSAPLVVMNWLILFSYVLATVFVFRILLHFKVSPLAALIFSGLITMFSPQLFAIAGHYGLAYSCFVPMLFYWVIRYDEGRRLQYPVYIFFLGFIGCFLHPYLMGLMLIWIILYAFGYFIFVAGTFRQRVRHVLPLLISLLLLVVAVKVVMKTTDPVTDRATTPYGMLVYCTTGKHIFSSGYSPVWKLVKEHFPSADINDDGEGGCYPGLAMLTIVIVSIVGVIINKRRKKAVADSAGSVGYPHIYIFIAFAALLYSMGVPFVWHLEWLLNYLSFFRQFRTLDRFAWIFYYMITIYGVVRLYHWFMLYRQQGRNMRAWSLLIIVLVAWGFEVSGYVLYRRSGIDHRAENYKTMAGHGQNDWQKFLSGHHYQPSDFQAILTLGFTHIGMDKLWLGSDYDLWGLNTGFEASLQLNLPIIDAMLARTSWSQIEKQVKIAAGPYVHKPMLDDLKSNKPFLLMYYEHNTLTPDQQYLLTASDSIGHFDAAIVYACYPDRIRANDKMRTDSIRAIIPASDSCIRCTGSWYVNHFDSIPAKNALFGTGAVSQIQQLETVIAQIPVKAKYEGQTYEFSCWFLLGDEDYSSPYFRLDLLDDNGNVISTIDALTKESTDNHGLWFRLYRFIDLPVRCSTVRCRLFNEPGNTYKLMDEMMFRAADDIIISRSSNGRRMVNNHLLVGDALPNR